MEWMPRFSLYLNSDEAQLLQRNSKIWCLGCFLKKHSHHHDWPLLRAKLKMCLKKRFCHLSNKAELGYFLLVFFISMHLVCCILTPWTSMRKRPVVSGKAQIWYFKSHFDFGLRYRSQLCNWSVKRPSSTRTGCQGCWKIVNYL